MLGRDLTPWKFHSEKSPSQKERIVFQPSFFMGKLLVFGGVSRKNSGAFFRFFLVEVDFCCHNSSVRVVELQELQRCFNLE